MKRNLLPWIFLLPLFYYAQVGISNSTPAATLDITAKNATGTTSNVDGMLIPRVDRERAQSMTSIPTSTLIYVNSIATGSLGGTAVNIDTVGYYYFNGSVWTKLDTSFNIYNSDGTLSGNRQVNMGTNTLFFQNGSNRINFNHTVTDANINMSAVTRANIRLAAGFGAAASNLSIFQDINSSGQILVSGASSGLYVGSTTGSTSPVHLATNGAIALTAINGGNVGVGTITPQRKLHVNGDLQITNELNVGGSSGAAGSAGTSGQILTSNGAGVAPTWKTLNTSSGTISTANYVQGTTALTINQGAVADVPGVTITLTVPAGITQTFLFTVLGYATSSTATDAQGAFYLLQNGVKISSAYTSMVSGTALVRLPIPVTFLKAVTLAAGTYTFKVQYSAWAGNQIVNFVPSTYSGYNGDTEAMLTKMQVLVYNN
ncbi:hypothetical protein HNP38_001203 [Chryseobacterium defluvii]|uniref:Uncharacterized protein n=1 Tax=Chryseobacterium defluvii TaxID=160396 RepID=A0A840K8Y2_9FLAO|nr:hypothetical protein [Chryseobacterium defluvii]MBB4805931.1 hypothetical protein [Chryseobacterium defluvii]